MDDGYLVLRASALQARAIRVAFGARDVLHSVDFSLQAGGVTALVGPNGSGKSTLLRALARLVPVVSGSIAGADGEDVDALSPRQFARYATLLSQQRPVPVGITVGDLVGYGRHPYRAGWRGRDADGATAIRRWKAEGGKAMFEGWGAAAEEGGKKGRDEGTATRRRGAWGGATWNDDT